MTPGTIRADDTFTIQQRRAAFRAAASLSADNEHVVRRMRELFKLAEEADDVETGDILVRRMQYHAKQAWMLRSSLQRVAETAKAV